MKLKPLVYSSLVTLLTALLPAQAQTFSVIHAFTGDADGAHAYAGLTLRGGKLYGTTHNGAAGFGTVYEMANRASTWVATPIYIFSGNDGAEPIARVVFGPDGHLYGTTSRGGADNKGTFFGLTPPAQVCKTAKCLWTERALYQFSGSDGYTPGYGEPVWDERGNIYGTTVYGGSSNVGVVYELQPSGNSWTGTSIYSFSRAPDGAFPFGGLVFDSDGNLFGTASGDGLFGFGTVYELTSDMGVGWTKYAIYDFQNGSDGNGPEASLITDAAGNFYGSTAVGGAGGHGTVFELSPSGGAWTFKVLYSFSGLGFGPMGALTMDAAGNLYGTTYSDGTYSDGNVFKLANTGNGWAYTSLHDFSGGADGRNPMSNVTIDAAGNLYGTASMGGYFEGSCAQYVLGCGTVWMIKP